MSMPKKEYIRISLRLDKDVAEALEKMANETGITKTAIIEKSVMQFVDNYNKTGKLKQKKHPLAVLRMGVFWVIQLESIAE